MTQPTTQRQTWVMCALLGAMVLIVFWPALHCDFVTYDDPDYVTRNKAIQHGLNWQIIKWAFTTGHAANWHPLTWISHAADFQLFGLNPAGYHLTNLLLHLLNSVLLFRLLNRMTGAFWRSAFVAAIFALHPLRVESVVWVSERKDVLSTFFWMLTVGAYVSYAEAFKVQSASAKATADKSSRFKVFYALALVFYALGLTAKPMIVTLPFVLLLLDYWPLNRLGVGANFSWRPILEKIPFFLLAAGDSATTFLIQNHFGVVENLATFPLSMRLANVPVTYTNYLSKNFWPAGLAIFYPARSYSHLESAGAICLLAAITFLALRNWRTKPYLAVGWFWFLGVLVPTVGFIQLGSQAMADRYSYVPSIGLWIMVAWGARDWIGERPSQRIFAALAGGAAIVACLILTSIQVSYWRNSFTLFTHAAEVTDHNYLAYYNLGCYAKDRGEYAQAIQDFHKAMEIDTSNFIGVNQARAHNNLGFAYLHEGEITNAVAEFEKALATKPVYPEAYYNMGRAFLTNQQPDVAVDCFQRALAQDPSVAEIHSKLATTLEQLGRPAEAIAQFSQALQLDPDMDDAANNLAWLLATCPDHSLRNGAKAVELARQASEQSRNNNPAVLGTLAAAYAEVGKLSEAEATARQARDLALAQHNPALAGVLEAQCRHYQTGRGEPSR